MAEETKEEKKEEKQETKSATPTNIFEALASLDGGETFIAELKEKEAQAKKLAEDRDRLAREKIELERKYATADAERRENEARMKELRLHNGELLSKIDKSYEGKREAEANKKQAAEAIFGKGRSWPKFQ